MPFRLKPLSFILAAIIGCGNSSRPVGEVCGSDAECAAQLCVGGICLEPDADADGDGITNRIERLLGSGVLDSDSDGDGVPDGTELGDPQTPRDTDGDGVLDCLESDDADSDGEASTVDRVCRETLHGSIGAWDDARAAGCVEDL